MEAINIPDRIEDLEIKYIFIKKWRWVDIEARESYQGHPEEGRVYRVAHHKKTKSFRFVIPGHDLMLIDSLTNTDERRGYVCDCELVEKRNLLTLNFKEEDLDKILNWTEIKNQDLFQQPIPLGEFMSNINNLHQQMETADRMAYLTEAITRLDSVNSIQVEVVIELIEHLYEKNLEAPLNLEDISMDKKNGLGVNISRTQDALKRYAGTDRRTNEDSNDLYEAMGHLVVESERRLLNELD